MKNMQPINPDPINPDRPDKLSLDMIKRYREILPTVSLKLVLSNANETIDECRAAGMPTIGDTLLQTIASNVAFGILIVDLEKEIADLKTQNNNLRNLL